MRWNQIREIWMQFKGLLDEIRARHDVFNLTLDVDPTADVVARLESQYGCRLRVVTQEVHRS